MNDARLEGEITDDDIYFKNVAPLVVAIDYKALFGDAYKGRQSIVEMFEFDARKVPAFIVFSADSKRARESFDDGLEYEQDERPPCAGPHDIGEACYYKGQPAPGDIPEMHFIRKNVLAYFPDGGIDGLKLGEEDRIMEGVKTFDSAIRDENPAVTVIRMPRHLHKISQE